MASLLDTIYSPTAAPQQQAIPGLDGSGAPHIPGLDQPIDDRDPSVASYQRTQISNRELQQNAATGALNLQKEQLAAQHAAAQLGASNEIATHPDAAGKAWGETPQAYRDAMTQKYPTLAAQLPTMHNEIQSGIAGRPLGVNIREGEQGSGKVNGVTITGMQPNPTVDSDGNVKPTDLQNTARMVATGDLKADLGRFPPAMKMHVYNLAKQINPQFSQQNYEAQQEARKAFLPSGKNGQTITNANTLVNHLGEVADHIDALHNWSGGKWVNSLPNSISGNVLGNTAIGAFNTAANTAADEYAKVVAGGNVPDAEQIRNAHAMLDSDLGPDQLRANLKTMAAMMAGRIGTLQNEWNATVGQKRDVPFLEDPARQILQTKLGFNPDAIDAVRREAAAGQPASPALAQQPTSDQPVQVKTPQEAAALAPGTIFITPDGRRKIR